MLLVLDSRHLMLFAVNNYVEDKIVGVIDVM